MLIAALSCRPLLGCPAHYGDIPDEAPRTAEERKSKGISGEEAGGGELTKIMAAERNRGHSESRKYEYNFMK